jgi:Methyltransferase domain
MNIHRLIDRCQQWLRYPQPSSEQRELLGLKTDSFDIDFTARRLAAESSAEYLVANMRQARNFACDYDLHEAVRDWVKVDGHRLEFGVATGRTIRHWARLWPDETIHGFDSFEGLPETWLWNIRQGHFAQKLPRVPGNVQLHQGWFEETLPGWLEHQGPVAFLHIDSDLYSSARYVLDALKHRIVPGTVIVFDEYFNFPGWQQDEFRAWQEFVAENKTEYEYLGFVSSHQEVAVRVVKKPQRLQKRLA